MDWEIEFTDEFDQWWESLTEPEQESVTFGVDLLAELGPALSRPYADTIKASVYPNLKELRGQHEGRPYRVLYVFDPRRVGLLLVGGDKTGDANWYAEAIRKAEKLYAAHLKSLKK
jgi:hypothetical protein